jgi:hypothetical protein
VRNPEIETLEISVTKIDEDRRPIRRGWKHGVGGIVLLALAAALVLVAVLVHGGRSRSTTTARSAQSLAPASMSAMTCVDAAGYGGLGARVNDFDANNNNSTGPSEPSPGTAWYDVTGTARGCVTAFSVRDSSSPRLSARDLLTLVSRPYLPLDAKPLVYRNACALWQSATLEQATGRGYARALAVAQTSGVPGWAEIAATSSPTC